MKVVLLPDYHGVPECVSWQMKNLPAYAKQPERTIVLNEPLTADEETVRLTSALRSGECTFDRFWEDLASEKYWGPSEPYRNLYWALHNSGFELGPLDQDGWDRVKAARSIRQLCADYTDRERKGISLEDLSIRFDSMKRGMVFERERKFCANVDAIRYAGDIDTVVAVTHPAHIPGLERYFTRIQGYEVQIVPVEPALAEQLAKEEERIQLAAAEEAIKLETPPIVPIVFWAFENIRITEADLAAARAAAAEKKEEKREE